MMVMGRFLRVTFSVFSHYLLFGTHPYGEILGAHFGTSAHTVESDLTPKERSSGP